MSHTPKSQSSDHDSNRRRQVRVEAELSVRFADVQGIFVEECIANVSKGGMFVETLAPRKMNDILEVFIKIPETQEEITVQGEVVHVTDPKEDSEEFDGRVGMGIRFLLVEPKQKEILKVFIEGLLKKGGSGTRRDVRVYSHKEIKVRPANVNEFKTKFIPNLSRGGLFIETSEEGHKLFDVLDINLIDLEGDNSLHIQGEIVHIRRGTRKEKDLVKGLGVKFIGVDDRQQKKIDQFIEKIVDEKI
jgi:uncharacterized protein (TIGR02266 family)